MNRFKLIKTIMNRFLFLLCATCAISVTALLPGISVTHADQDSATVKKAAEKDQAAAKRKADAAARALAKRAEFLKQRKESREYIRKVVEGQQPRPAASTPDNAGTGGAQ